MARWTKASVAGDGRKTKDEGWRTRYSSSVLRPPSNKSRAAPLRPANAISPNRISRPKNVADDRFGWDHAHTFRRHTNQTPAIISSASTTIPAISHALFDPPLGALFAAGAADGCPGGTAPGAEISGVATSAL